MRRDATDPCTTATLLLLLLASASMLQAQGGSPVLQLTPLSPGLMLPIHLTHSIYAGRTSPSTPIVARTTQRIPISKHSYLRAGTEITGIVVSSSGGTAPTLTLRFTAVHQGNQSIPLHANALAVAGFIAVSETAVPSSGATDRANSNPANWTTTQVGGDEVCRSGWVGDVINTSTRKVGFADYTGVYADPPAGSSGSPPLALGVFSSTAHGLYGFDELASLQSSGGDLTVMAPRKLVLHANDNLLLQVLPSPPPRPSPCHPR